MIEKKILDYLTGNLDIPVLMEVPETPPEKFVVIEKTGSGRENRITTSMLAVQSYAQSMYEAADLNEQVKVLMDGLAILPEVCASRLNSDYNYTNTNTKHYRYQAVYDVTHY
ncbi:MAG: hypothetical protein LUD72_04010 [Bacteroidales bacterium]|nr:hypothetical protein [Bacteroidales bacterium]